MRFFSRKILSKPIKDESPGDLNPERVPGQARRCTKPRATCLNTHVQIFCVILKMTFQVAQVFFQRTGQGDFSRLPATLELS